MKSLKEQKKEVYAKLKVVRDEHSVEIEIIEKLRKEMEVINTSNNGVRELADKKSLEIDAVQEKINE